MLVLSLWLYGCMVVIVRKKKTPFEFLTSLSLFSFLFLFCFLGEETFFLS